MRHFAKSWKRAAPNETIPVWVLALGRTRTVRYPHLAGATFASSERLNAVLAEAIWTMTACVQTLEVSPTRAQRQSFPLWGVSNPVRRDPTTDDGCFAAGQARSRLLS